MCVCGWFWYDSDLYGFVRICFCKDLCGFDISMAQKTGMDRSAVIQAYGKSELRRRPLTQTY